MADDTPEKVDMYSRDGKLYALIGGQMFPLKITAESMAWFKAQALAMGDDWDAPPKRQNVATPAAPAPEPENPKLMSRRREALATLQASDEASERFDQVGALRESFGVEAHECPGMENYEAARDRYLRRTLADL